ncbi:MAG: CHASE3 domain-containing protein [Chitinophagaceae bacterium]
MVSFLSLKGKVWSGYMLAFVLLLVSYFLIFYTMQRSIRETNSVAHTYNVINRLETLRGQITEAETGLRGYILTHDHRFLAPYDNALVNIPVLFSELKTLTEDNSHQQNNLDTLMMLMNERLKYMSIALTAFRANGMVVTDSMRRYREPSKRVMDSIRVFGANIQAQEEQYMEQRKGRLSGFFDSTQIIAIISLAIAFITLFYSLIIFNKENKAKEKATEKAMNYSIDLENNITKLKTTNIELEEFKSLEKFTATGRIARTIAHEVRNPLTNISLAAEQLLESNVSGTKENTVLLEMISRNAGRINQLVSELLNATRFAHLDFQKTDVKQLLEETLEMAKDRIDLNHVQVEKNYSDESIFVLLDAEKIKFAMLNIIVNAIEAMEKDLGVLMIRTKKQRDKCVIEVRDNGKGMTDDVLQNLFEPYFTGKMKGNGLGLTNTQNIIFNHKGRIKVYSKPGQGATFLVFLNLETADETVIPQKV